MWAITPNGAGVPVGARRILPSWPLADGETFRVASYTPPSDDGSHPGDVLAEDERSLRPPTEAEIERYRESQQPGLPPAMDELLGRLRSKGIIEAADEQAIRRAPQAGNTP